MRGKTPVSCIPCAKRKVRCDKLQPCCHCKRRQHERCVYPDADAEANSVRITKLEQHVRNLGGDPERAQIEGAQNGNAAKGGVVASDKTLGLVAHDEEVTYIETFLCNVQPLVKIFFDWDVEQLIRKNPASLSDGERALVVSIAFITTLSLSPEECNTALGQEKDEALHGLQREVEAALSTAEYATSTDKRTFQALMLYLLTMRDRARPAAIFSLMGVASRVAVRMGLHRDGTLLGLDVVRSEERRRMWWQLQIMELAVARLVGSLSLTLFAEWDSQFPANNEDSDFTPDTATRPAERTGLTSMSQCLWRYDILRLQRQTRRAAAAASTSPTTTTKESEDLPWMLSPNVPLPTKDSRIDGVEQMLGTKYLQHCELLDPLHVYIQIGIRQFLLAFRRTVRQPALVNARISGMSMAERDDFLGLCTKGIEYYVVSQTDESLRGFQWQNEGYFQWPSFVYIILEAHHRAESDDAAQLWKLLRRVYEVHPDLKSASQRPEIASVARITLAAWQKYDAHLRARDGGHATRAQQPEWIVELCRNFELPQIDPEDTDMEQQLALDASRLLGVEFDFDNFDWTTWDDQHFSNPS